MSISATEITVAEKPKLRGVLHQYGFFVSLLLGIWVVFSAQKVNQVIPGIIYALSLSALLGTSALYHRVNWSERKRQWMRSIDRAMILVLIVGTYTPFGMCVFSGPTNDYVFVFLWISVAVGFVLNVLWSGAPKWLRAGLYVVVSWVGILMLPQLFDRAGAACAWLVLGGGVVYTVGAVFYALKKPNLIPGVFGYHELFHGFVLIGALLHYLAIAFYVFV